MVGASSVRMEKCLNSDSNRDPPAYAADCSTIELLRPRPDSQAREHLHHLASAGPLARESGRGLNSSMVEQSAA